MRLVPRTAGLEGCSEIEHIEDKVEVKRDTVLEPGRGSFEIPQKVAADKMEQVGGEYSSYFETKSLIRRRSGTAKDETRPYLGYSTLHVLPTFPWRLNPPTWVHQEGTRV